MAIVLGACATVCLVLTGEEADQTIQSGHSRFMNFGDFGMSLEQRSPSYGDAVHPAEIPMLYVGSRSSLEVILMRMMTRPARTQ